MPLTPIVQLVPLLQTRQTSGLATNYVLGLRANGDLCLIHVPWEGGEFQDFLNPNTGSFTVQVRELTQDTVHWDAMT